MTTTRIIKLRPRHQQRRIKHMDLEAKVDRRIATLILGLWQAGLPTVSSCQCNGEEGHIWVQFPQLKYAIQFITTAQRQLSSYHLQHDYVFSSESFEEGDDLIGCVSVRFDPGDLKKVKAMFPIKLK